MFRINEDKSIYVTRGDAVTFGVCAARDNGMYAFRGSDVVRFKVFEKKSCHCVVLQKDFQAAEGAESVDITLDGQDTKFGGIISKPVDYWYEVELNPETNPQTIIGYDENGSKVFRLFPEGGELE